MLKKSLKPNAALYPVPVILVTCSTEERGPNIITIAWTGVICSSPPMLSTSIRPSRYSHKIIKSQREFVANIPSVAIAREADYCGVVSGRRVDKFKETGLTPIEALKVKAPLIKECPVNLECRVRHIIHLGTHDLFLANIVALHVDSNILDDNGEIDFKKARPFVYNQGLYWDLQKQIGSYGYSLKK